jgi:hypothetical protein
MISKANHRISWSTPAPIVFGTSLGNTQLNAAVTGVQGGTAPGALTYTPAAGTILGVGTRQLRALMLLKPSTTIQPPQRSPSTSPRRVLAWATLGTRSCSLSMRTEVARSSKEARFLQSSGYVTPLGTPSELRDW